MTEYSQPTAFARGIFEERTDGEGAGGGWNREKSKLGGFGRVARVWRGVCDE